eukprot:TRINITY_DN13433_c0_g4_i1.p1 TRINITY_DN13433_c0_g4~~TRINITY_DN13433_c0_g4_i1.p1  ORF type:complete len:583 (+),score=133.73 TRINITY_DN13433_c0_g4_i1:141-1889(+)
MTLAGGAQYQYNAGAAAQQDNYYQAAQAGRYGQSYGASPMNNGMDGAAYGFGCQKTYAMPCGATPQYTGAQQPQPQQQQPPHMESGPVAEEQRVSMVVPEGALPGTKLNCSAPDGQELRLTVPEGVPPGSIMTLTQDPVTKQWKCMAEPLDGDGYNNDVQDQQQLFMDQQQQQQQQQQLLQQQQEQQQHLQQLQQQQQQQQPQSQPGHPQAYSQMTQGSGVVSQAYAQMSQPSTMVSQAGQCISRTNYQSMPVNLSYVPPPSMVGSSMAMAPGQMVQGVQRYPAAPSSLAVDPEKFNPPRQMPGAPGGAENLTYEYQQRPSYVPPPMSVMEQRPSWTPLPQVAMPQGMANPTMLQTTTTVQSQHLGQQIVVGQSPSYVPPPAMPQVVQNNNSYVPPPGAILQSNNSYVPPPAVVLQNTNSSYVPPPAPLATPMQPMEASVQLPAGLQPGMQCGQAMPAPSPMNTVPQHSQISMGMSPQMAPVQMYQHPMQGVPMNQTHGGMQIHQPGMTTSTAPPAAAPWGQQFGWQQPGVMGGVGPMQPPQAYTIPAMSMGHPQHMAPGGVMGMQQPGGMMHHHQPQMHGF